MGFHSATRVYLACAVHRTIPKTTICAQNARLVATRGTVVSRNQSGGLLLSGAVTHQPAGFQGLPKGNASPTTVAQPYFDLNDGCLPPEFSPYERWIPATRTLGSANATTSPIDLGYCPNTNKVLAGVDLRRHGLGIMKRKTLVITLLATITFVVGCSKEQTHSQQLDKVQVETKQAAQDMKNYTFAQKAEFVEKMQGQLAEINRDLDQLSAKVEKSSDAAKAEAKPKLQALRDQAGKLNQQLDEAKNTTESAWDDVKAGTQKAYAGLKDGFQQARQWVSDKIAP